jgi:hypothetical protein
VASVSAQSRQPRTTSWALSIANSISPASTIGVTRAFPGVSGRRRLLGSTEEAVMALARVVSFEGVGKDRMEEMRRAISEGERPENLPATEMIVLHDADAEKSVVLMFFETEDDYRRGDEVLSAMPAGDTPGRRTSVGKYDVVVRATA